MVQGKHQSTQKCHKAFKKQYEPKKPFPVEEQSRILKAQYDMIPHKDDPYRYKELKARGLVDGNGFVAMGVQNALALIKAEKEKPKWQRKVIDFSRYLVSAREKDELLWKQIKDIAEKAISEEAGRYVMTLEEKTKNEGRLEGLKEGIELGITLKFPGDIDTVMAKVNKIDDLVTLKEIKETIKTAQDISEIMALLK